MLISRMSLIRGGMKCTFERISDSSSDEAGRSSLGIVLQSFSRNSHHQLSKRLCYVTSSLPYSFKHFTRLVFYSCIIGHFRKANFLNFIVRLLTLFIFLAKKSILKQSQRVRSQPNFFGFPKRDFRRRPIYHRYDREVKADDKSLEG